MKPRRTKVIFLFLLIIISATTILWWFSKKGPQFKWMVYYGSSLSTKNLAGIDLAILEPENVHPLDFKPSIHEKTGFIGYLSVGEAEGHRDYWYRIKGKPFVVGENPNWPGAHYVDIRSEEWQHLLMEELIPRILEKGYKGLFLDTVDTAIYLENLDPQRYAGSKEALVSLVLKIRRAHPNIILIPNNGFEFLDDYGGSIDGVVVEDVHTRYDFEGHINQRTPLADMEVKEKYLDQFIQTYHKPVFNILYADSPHTEPGRSAIRRSEKKGYLWYLTSVDLMKIGIAN